MAFQGIVWADNSHGIPGTDLAFLPFFNMGCPTIGKQTERARLKEESLVRLCGYKVESNSRKEFGSDERKLCSSSGGNL